VRDTIARDSTVTAPLVRPVVLRGRGAANSAVDGDRVLIDRELSLDEDAAGNAGAPVSEVGRSRRQR